MRIGIDTHFVTSAHATGNRTYTVELANALTAADPQNEYILYAEEDHPFYRRLQARKNVSIRYVLHSNGWIRNFISLPRAIAQDRLDVVHLHFIMAPYVVVPVVLWVPDLYYVHMQQKLSYEWGIGKLTRFSTRWATHIVTLSDYSRQDILRTLSLPLDRVTVTSAAANARFSPALGDQSLAQIKANLGITRDYILFVGRTEDPRKNIQTLLDAYILLRQAGVITEQLVIAGRHGPGTLAIEERIRTSGLQVDILMPGIIADADLPVLMSGARVFAYAPSFEGFGLPVLEAISCGTPVITSSVTSLPEVAGNAAVYVSPGNVEEMKAALLLILSQPGLRQLMRAQGLIQASKFSWQRTALETLRIFEEVVASYPKTK